MGRTIKYGDSSTMDGPVTNQVITSTALIDPLHSMTGGHGARPTDRPPQMSAGD